MEIKRFLRVEVAANWKAVFDNFIESYHINTVHPAITRWLDSQSFGATPLRNGHAYYTLQRKNRNRIVEQDGLHPPGEFERYTEFAINFPIFPNVSGGLDTGGFVWESFWPAGSSRTIIDIPLFGWVGATNDAYWDTVMAENVRLLGEDLQIIPGVYKAMRTGHVPDIILGYQELGIYWYHEEIDRRIGRDRIAPELRVAPVLAAHAID
jgi:phenylpropionate dioxygenase-like ring-hydroxylating dioxygenase large terminal subunit